MYIYNILKIPGRSYIKLGRTEPTALQRRSDLCIPRNETARPRSQFPHLCNPRIGPPFWEYFFSRIFGTASLQYVDYTRCSSARDIQWSRQPRSLAFSIFMFKISYIIPRIVDLDPDLDMDRCRSRKARQNLIFRAVNLGSAEAGK